MPTRQHRFFQDLVDDSSIQFPYFFCNFSMYLGSIQSIDDIMISCFARGSLNNFGNAAPCCARAEHLGRKDQGILRPALLSPQDLTGLAWESLQFSGNRKNQVTSCGNSGLNQLANVGQIQILDCLACKSYRYVQSIQSIQFQYNVLTRNASV